MSLQDRDWYQQALREKQRSATKVFRRESQRSVPSLSWATWSVLVAVLAAALWLL